MMDIVRIEQKVSELLKKSGAQQLREKGYVYYHGKRVAELAMKIYSEVKKEPAGNELDRLYVAGLMHDIGKGKKHHAAAGAKMAGKILTNDLDRLDLLEIQRLIMEHNLRERPNVCELDSKALQDADVLDHFGAQGVWLSVYITANSGGDQGDMLKYYMGSDHKRYVEEKFYALNFDISKKMFKERYDFQKEFVNIIRNM